MDTLDSVLKIVIVHEDLMTGIEAAAVLKRLVIQLDAEFEINSDGWQIDSSVWKFGRLRDPELWKQATAEAAEADMIIISVGGAKLSASVRDWIETVLPMKEGTPAALVALVDRENDTSGELPRPEAYFRRLAGRYGLDFFCNTDDQTRHTKSGIESIVSHCHDNPTTWSSHSPELPPARMGHPRAYLEKN